ncbi:MAG: 50S ribosome-binding GTPase [Nanoarchaeota archaeon]|nr:50S ribosome-binding GTPase [Nanoarchaeota archaeon]
MPSYWRLVHKVIAEADVLLLLLDARLVDDTRNPEIEFKVKRDGKPLIYVITKCDLISQREAEQHKRKFRPCVFVSATEHHGFTMLRDRILIEGKKLGRKEVKVGVLGYPNVGKSSLINALKGKHSAPTSSVSGYTKALQKVRADSRIMLLDTPGVIPFREKDNMKHSLTGSIDFDKTKDPELVVMELMERCPGMIEKHFGVKPDEDLEIVIDAIARKMNMLKRGSLPDTQRAACMILKEWQEGKIDYRGL